MQVKKYEVTKLFADEGMVLTNGTERGREVYLGKYDSPDNWYEVPETEADLTPELTEEVEQ